MNKLKTWNRYDNGDFYICLRTYGKGKCVGGEVFMILFFGKKSETRVLPFFSGRFHCVGNNMITIT